MMKTIHLISRQVGTAYPHSIFAKILRDQGFHVEVFAYPLSFGILNSAQTTPIQIENFSDYLAQMKTQPDLVFTGTSEMAEDDGAYWCWAHQRKIPSFAWLDQIVNFEKRFVSLSDATKLPTLILTNDEATLAEIRLLNIPTKMNCIGSPYIEELLSKIDRTKKQDHTAFFASEPAMNDYRPTHGFDDIDSFAMASRVLHSIEGKTQRRWNILVKLHPRDSLERFHGELQRRYPSCAVETTHMVKEDILSSAHVVIGMRSMFLFESASAGIPTISFQPHRKTNCAYLDQHRNVLTVTSETHDLQSLIQFVSTDSMRAMTQFSAGKFYDLVQSSLTLLKYS